MAREYKIQCVPPKSDDIPSLLKRLPSPAQRNSFEEIYNYRIEEDGIYFIDHLVARDVAAVALRVFLDAALVSNKAVTIFEA